MVLWLWRKVSYNRELLGNSVRTLDAAESTVILGGQHGNRFFHSKVHFHSFVRGIKS